MSDWQAGDLALCVTDEPWTNAKTGAPSYGPTRGSVMLVEHVGQFSDVGTILAFAEWPRDYFEANAFRKIAPHQPDAEDRQTIWLYTKMPKRELA